MICLLYIIVITLVGIITWKREDRDDFDLDFVGVHCRRDGVQETRLLVTSYYDILLLVFLL